MKTGNNITNKIISTSFINGQNKESSKYYILEIHVHSIKMMILYFHFEITTRLTKPFEASSLQNQ